jgi:hypothetical protein
VTVRSADDYPQTYSLPGDAGQAPAVSDRVVVRAQRAGPAATVTTIERH